jgi:lipopolysaccharide transport protein LptA
MKLYFTKTFKEPMSPKPPTKTLPRCITIFTGLLFFLVSAIAPVLAAENNQSGLLSEKVDYSADGIIMSITGSIRYLNLNDNVKVTQGSLVILGDTAVVEIDEPTRELLKVTVHGTPVLYSQDLDTAGTSVSGRSDIIVMFSQQETGESVVELTGNAHIESPDTTLNCAAIVYLPRLDLVPNTTGPCVGSFTQE